MMLEPSPSTNKTNEFVQPTDSFFTLMSKHNPQFTEIEAVINALQLSKYLMLPQNIEKVSNKLESDVNLVAECLSYLELVATVSLICYGNEKVMLNKFIDILVSTKIVGDIRRCNYATSYDHFNWSDRHELKNFLEDNVCIMAFYIFDMIDMVTGRK